MSELHFNVEEFWNEDERLLHPNPAIPIASNHNILEITGKLFWYYSITEHNDEMVEKIIKGLWFYWTAYKFIPRSVYHGDNPPPERKKDAWVEIKL